MGWFPADLVNKGATVILRRLEASDEVRYSQLCNNFDDIDLKDLGRELFADEYHGKELEDFIQHQIEDGEWGPEMAVTFAAGQLAAAGLVSREFTGEVLAYEEQEFVLRLTERGRAFLDSGGRFEGEGVDL